MLTKRHKDEEIDEIYEQLEEVIKNIKDRNNLMLGDWHAV